MTKKTSRPPIPQPGTNNWPFKLGDKVKDKLSDIEGTLTTRYYHRTGCDRFVLEVVKDATTLEDLHFDAGRLELVEARPDLHIDEVPDLHFKLGDKVKDAMVGLTGRVGIIAVPLFGAVRASIDPDWDAKNKKLPEGFFCDAHMIEVLEAYDGRPKAETKPSEEQKKKQKPGAVRMPTRSIG